MSKIQQLVNGMIDLYLYPDQIIFGHLMNPNMKCAHNYQFGKSNKQKQQSDQLIVYQKQMSKTTIKSMLNLMEGNHPPLFKSSISNKAQHNYNQNKTQQQFQDEQDDQDYDSYEDEMYLMQNDYQNQFDEQYDDQQNPIMALGHSFGALPTMKSYVKDYNLNQSNINNRFSSQLHKSSQKLNNSSNRQKGLAHALRINQDKKSKNNKIIDNQSNKMKGNNSGLIREQKNGLNKKNENINQSQQDWQTQTEDQGQQKVNNLSI